MAAQLATLRYGADGRGSVEINGQKVMGVRGMRLDTEVFNIPRLTLDVIVHEIKIDGEVEAEVRVPDRTREGLLTLGWTPPDSPETLHGAYTERARLVAFLASLYPSVLAYSDPSSPDWPVVTITTPGGQMSWHIAPRDRHLFDHVPAAEPDDPRAQWDGHSTDTKYERLAALTRGEAPR